MEAGRFLQAAVVVTAITLASRVLGLVREALFAGLFGVDRTTDAFFVALRIPDLIFNSLTNFLVAVAFVPVFAAVRREEGDAAAFAFARSACSLLVLGLALLAAVLMAAAGPIVALMAPGLPGEAQAQAVAFGRIMIPIIVVAGLIGLGRSLLNLFGRHTLPAATPLVFNLVVILAIVAGWAGGWGIEAVAWGVLAAALAQQAVLVPAMRRAGFRFRLLPVPSVDDRLRRVGALAVPVVAGILLGKAMEFLEIMLASNLGEGAVSYLGYAARIWTMPEQVFTIVVSSVLFPILVDHAAGGRRAALAGRLAEGLRWTIFIVLPASVAMAAFSVEIVGILFGRGEFDEAAVHNTAAVLAAYSAGLFAVCARSLVSYAFFAVGDTRLLLKVGAAMIPVNLGLDLLLIREFSYVGLALGATITAWMQLAILLVALHRRFGRIDRLAASFAKAVVSAAAMYAVLLAVRDAAPMASPAPAAEQVRHMLAAGGAGCVAYLASAYALKTREAHDVWGRMKGMLNR